MNVLVTGADRGIGEALCRAYRARGDRVVAACFGDSPGLRSAGLRVEPSVDVTSTPTCCALADRLRRTATRIDVLINNAGVAALDRLGSLDYDKLRRLFEVNALGPLRVTEALLDLFAPGARVAIVTSRLGSLGDNTSGGRYGYRLSKCAANMAGINLHQDLKQRGIAVVMLHPGQVRTAMAVLDEAVQGVEPEVAAEGLMRQIDRASPNEAPAFVHAKGTLLPWSCDDQPDFTGQASLQVPQASRPAGVKLTSALGTATRRQARRNRIGRG
ncbi:MAG: SDR family oxidoreductase [Alphaproteobacteria bacterium]|nr:SDR family oxidoreductase [Alphaproteobacteria bacterium]